jgi:sortase A
VQITSPAGTTAATDTPVDTTADTVPIVVAPTAAATPDAFSDGWFSDTSAIFPSILWALVLAGIAYGIYWLSHKVRRYWVGVLSGFVPFIVSLYFFYENINRLLPPNL